MGRKKGYDREALVQTAVEIFHRHGFRGASTAILVKEMGVNRNSVYSEFGSKEALFAAALERYDQQVVTQLFGPLESPTATLDEIEALYRTFSESAGWSTGLGCLMGNTAAELGGVEPNLHPLVESYFDRLHRAFGNALRGAIRAGQVEVNMDIAIEARFLTSCCVGLFLMVRSGIVASAAQEAIGGALGHLQLLRCQRRSKNASAGRSKNASRLTA